MPLEILSSEVEAAFVAGILDNKCDPHFADELRSLFLNFINDAFPIFDERDDQLAERMGRFTCPQCKGLGMVTHTDGGSIEQEGCDVCGGTGKVKVSKEI